MIVKILKATASFSAVRYNTNKIDKNKGELMKVANFGPLQGLGKLRPRDYINYLELISAQNRNISKPQFHAIISGKGLAYDKGKLTMIADNWLKEMGYGAQPYLIIFHKDTENNHVHMVSTRVDRNGVKIPADFEYRRAMKSLQKVLGYELGFQYKFSTRAQFFLVLESMGYLGTDPDEKKIMDRIDKFSPDRNRALVLRQLLIQYNDTPGFINLLKSQFNIELIFHAAEGKKPYGYTIIDHGERQVFKGSEVLALKELLKTPGNFIISNPETANIDEQAFSPAFIQSIRIADDVDDQQVHGMKRRKQKKARTNTR